MILKHGGYYMTRGGRVLGPLIREHTLSFCGWAWKGRKGTESEGVKYTFKGGGRSTAAPALDLVEEFSLESALVAIIEGALNAKAEPIWPDWIGEKDLDRAKSAWKAAVETLEKAESVQQQTDEAAEALWPRGFSEAELDTVAAIKLGQIEDGLKAGIYDELMDQDYVVLKGVLDDAYAQSSRGKGKQRHANGQPFDRQPIMEIGRMVGAGGTAFQVLKKTQEAIGMTKRGEHEAAERELLGAIVYAAATVLLVREAKSPLFG
jgi:hypothetical protein